MDAENKPAENEADVVSPPATLSVAPPAGNASHNDAGGRAGPAASEQSAALWGQILMVLCAAGVGLVIGILALQVTEYLFYKAPPDVWPQPGAGGTINAPATLAAPLSPVPIATSSAAPATVSAPASPTGRTSTPASTNVPVVAKP